MPEMWREKTAFVFAFFWAILLATNVKADDITDEYVQVHGETVDSRRFTTGKQKVRDGAVYYFLSAFRMGEEVTVGMQCTASTGSGSPHDWHASCTFEWNQIVLT